MTQFFAQPYDVSAVEFQFERLEEFQDKVAVAANQNDYPVEEFTAQFKADHTVNRANL
jgi:hypothetical protein